MSTIKNGQILLYCHFNNFIKEPGTSFQFPASSQRHVRYVCHTEHKYLTKFHFDSTQDSKEISVSMMHMMTSQSLKSIDFTKTEKSRYLESKSFFFTTYISQATLWQKIVLQQR